MLIYYRTTPAATAVAVVSTMVAAANQYNIAAMYYWLVCFNPDVNSHSLVICLLLT